MGTLYLNTSRYISWFINNIWDLVIGIKNLLYITIKKWLATHNQTEEIWVSERMMTRLAKSNISCPPPPLHSVILKTDMTTRFTNIFQNIQGANNFYYQQNTSFPPEHFHPERSFIRHGDDFLKAYCGSSSLS